MNSVAILTNAAGYTRIGAEAVTLWHKLDCEQDTSLLGENICARFEGTLRLHVDSTPERLADSQVEAVEPSWSPYPGPDRTTEEQ